MMELDSNVTLISGFYPSEGDFVWGGQRAFLRIQNARFQTLVIQGHLGISDAKITVYECELNSEADYSLSKKSDGLHLTVNLYSESTLLCIECDKCLQPNIELDNSSDYRRLGMCYQSIRLMKGDVSSVASTMKIDIEQTKFHLENYQKRGVCDADYLFLENFKTIHIPGSFLDIGANVGQSALSLASVHPTVRILSYEPNQLLIPNLEIVRRVLRGRMKYIAAGAGVKSEHKKFYIPYIGDTFFSQEGSFCLEEVQSSECLNRIKGDYGRLDELCLKTIDFDIVTLDSQGIEATYFVKIDTQGFEKEAIQGMGNIIEQFHPVIMMEKGFDEEEMFSILKGYNLFHYDHKRKQFVEYDTHTANAFFIHNDLTKNEDINSILRTLYPST